MSERGAASLLPSFVSLLTALWAGSLWTVCGIAAPAAFATLERHQAGQVAAQLFRIEAWLGVTVAAILLALLAARGMLTSARLALSLIVITAIAPLASELLVTPAMDAALAVADRARFGKLHGVSATLFLIACISAVGLVWQLPMLTTREKLSPQAG